MRKTKSATRQHQLPQLTPKTEAQQRFISAINHHSIVVATGPAGCGKSYVGAGMAATALTKGYVQQIVLSRANVPTGRTLGHFPGSITDKLTPWLMPTLSVLNTFLGPAYDYGVSKGVIQMQPLETIRGRSFEDTFIIVDEAQNLVRDEVISIVTRLGEGSKLLLLGDPVQSDIRGENGLTWFSQFAEKYSLSVPVIKFGLEDVVRSKVVRDILVALYSEYKIQA